MKATAEREVVITAPKFLTAQFRIRGTAPYVQNKFSRKAKDQMKSLQEAGPKGKNKKNRKAKDFKECYEQAQYVSSKGWNGIPASSFRCAMISACRVAGFVMTKAKLAVFVEADGFDEESGTPLVKIVKGKPQYAEHPVRNESGVCDIRPRPMWREGWEAIVRIRYDNDQFGLEDVANLMMRVGQQVGLGEGRPDSKKSCGMGWGTFDIIKGDV